MEQPIRIGMDASKRVFQLHGVNAAEEVVLRKKLRRKVSVFCVEKLKLILIILLDCLTVDRSRV